MQTLDAVHLAASGKLLIIEQERLPGTGYGLFGIGFKSRDFVGIHHMTILGLSYDHRAFDGVTASKFLAYIRDTLQERDWEAELG